MWTDIVTVFNTDAQLMTSDSGKGKYQAAITETGSFVKMWTLIMSVGSLCYPVALEKSLEIFESLGLVHTPSGAGPVATLY